MSRLLLAAALTASTALTPPAWADIAPAEVWDGLKQYLESFGYEVTGVEQGGADMLQVRDTLLNLTLPQDQGSVRVDLGDLTFTADGGGVILGFPDVMPIAFDISDSGAGERVQGVIEYRQAGMQMRVDGTMQDMSYSYAAERLDLSLTELRIDDAPRSREEAKVDIALIDVSGSSDIEMASLRSISQILATGQMAYDIFFSDPAENGTLFRFTGVYRDVDSTSSATLPLRMDMTNLPALLAAGFTTKSTLSHKGAQGDFNVTDRGDINVSSNRSESGSMEITLNSDGLAVSVRGTGTQTQVIGSAPVPIAFSADISEMAVSLPVTQSAAPQPFSLRTALRGMQVNEALWAMIDPGGQLPRDPATLAMDADGEIRLPFDLFDPTLMQGEMPREAGQVTLERLTLNDLRLDLAGASLSGAGGFIFDNTDLQTFRGMPRPEGEINLELNGANTLIDTLVRMGLLPQEQAMGARMFMAMFAQPVGDDQLRSKIEINASGHVLANGQRIQ